jgi:putative ABC transport system permease protein
MSLLSSVRSVVSALFRRERVESEMDEEIRAHVRNRADDLERSGLARAAAERRARIEFGGGEKYKEQCREAMGTSLLDAMMQDLRFGLRMLRKSPGFTAVAILTLALGIGASTAIFTLVNTMLFQRLGVKASNRLIIIWVNNMEHGWSRIGPSGRDYLDWKEQNHSFEDLFLFEHGTGTVTGKGEPEQVAGLRVTTNFGEFLGITPIAGRTFRKEEGAARHNYLILGNGYWQRHFGADMAVVGRGIKLNGEEYTIIGVLPAEVAALFPADVVVPFDNEWLKRADSDLGVFGRLKDGVTLGEASSEMSVIMKRIGNQRPSRRGYGSVLVPLESARVEFFRPALLVLLAAVGFVLLIACANVANLMLARAVGRQREVALRMTMGAGARRLLRQFMTESTLLALLGGGAGMLVALWATNVLMRYVPSRILVPNAADHVLLPKVHLDGRAFAFTVLISLTTSILFGLVPALQSLRHNVSDSLKEGGTGTPTGQSGHHVRGTLVIVEVALAFVLAIGATLMIRSFSQLLAANPGFNPDHLLTLRIKLPNDAKDSPYQGPRQRAAAFQRFLTQIEAVPGVQSAAFTEIIPLSQDDMDMGVFVIKEQPPLPAGQQLSADFRDVSGNYFRTMGIPLMHGRTFTEQDNLDHQRVVMIDETLARRFFPNEDPVGKHLQIPDATRPEHEIVGVVGAVHDTGFDQQPRPTIYFPFLQSPDQSMSLVARTALPPSSVLPAVKGGIWTVDRNQPVFNVRPMEEIIADVTSAQRVAFLALDVFATLALVLAAIGIYGVTSYAVRQRTHEIGIRMALGANPSGVMRLVLGQGAKLAIAGVAIGALATVGVTRLMTGLLYGVSPTDPAIFGVVALLFGCVALAACYVPARRAMRVDPMVALRYE